jgi:hypothetical protein
MVAKTLSPFWRGHANEDCSSSRPQGLGRYAILPSNHSDHKRTSGFRQVMPHACVVTWRVLGERKSAIRRIGASSS